MPSPRPVQRMFCAVLSLICAAALLSPAQPRADQPAQTAHTQSTKSSRFPYAEKLSYRVEWRLITAGSATVDLSRDTPENWLANLHVESAGWVTRLYPVLDNYKVSTTAKFCGTSSFMDSQEGKRHTITKLEFEKGRNKVSYYERDVLKKSEVKKELEVPPCTYEIVGALASLRTSDLQPGKWANFPMTDGKKAANARIEAQSKETLNINGKSYGTIRYEAFLFDNILYKRRGRLLIWISDDADRIPVQLRLQMGFPIGSVTVQLDKQQRM